MVKHIKLFEQFINEEAKFDKFIDITKIIGDGKGGARMDFAKGCTVKDKDGETVSVSDEILVYDNEIEIGLSDEGGYQIGEVLSGSINLSKLKGLNLDLTKAVMKDDFRNLKINNGILTFEYTIPKDLPAKLKDMYSKKKTGVFDKFKEIAGIPPKEKVPNFSICIPSSSIEDSGKLIITILFSQDTQLS
jgi:hypothetical protein